MQPSSTSFHGEVPGPSHSLIGNIRLDVIFGSENNFLRETIWFEVVNLASTYHALLGRPALANFMAVPHYGYLKMKLPGPNGVITMAGCFRRSMACAKEGAKIVEALLIAEEKSEMMRNVAMLQQAVSAGLKPVGDMAFHTTKDTRKIPLNPADPSRCVTIGAVLDSK